MKHSKISLVILILFCFVFLGFKMTRPQEEKLLQISKEYKGYQQYRDVKIIVTDSSKYQWTVVLCRSMPENDMGRHYKIDSSFVSKADKSISPHGNKLYRLFIKDYDSYIRNAPIGQPIGQVVVKETWNVNEIIYDSLNKTIQQIQSKNDGKWYTPTTVSELFIMYKENKNQINDNGWTYGIVSLENKNERPLILTNEKRSTCIRCHAGTKYDRIFGVK